MRILVIRRTTELGTPMDDTVLDITVPSCAPHSPGMFVPEGALRTAMSQDVNACPVFYFRLPSED